jgi:[ribosomal protein S5]-alanine N-acetyltransferase
MDYYTQETERLLLRKLTEADVETWEAFFVDNPNARFIGMDLSQDKKLLAGQWIRKQLDRYDGREFGQLAAIEKSTGAFAGLGGILVRDLNGIREYEISYSMLPTHWGKGYATELAVHMKRFGLKNGVSDRFISIIHRENVASMNVAAKNGMTKRCASTFLGMEVFIFGD